MIEDNAWQLSCHVCIIQCLLISLGKHCMLGVYEGKKNLKRYANQIPHKDIKLCYTCGSYISSRSVLIWLSRKGKCQPFSFMTSGASISMFFTFCLKRIKVDLCEIAGFFFPQLPSAFVTHPWLLSANQHWKLHFVPCPLSHVRAVDRSNQVPSLLQFFAQ